MVAVYSHDLTQQLYPVKTVDELVKVFRLIAPVKMIQKTLTYYPPGAVVTNNERLLVKSLIDERIEDWYKGWLLHQNNEVVAGWDNLRAWEVCERYHQNAHWAAFISQFLIPQMLAYLCVEKDLCGYIIGDKQGRNADMLDGMYDRDADISTKYST